jgi:hypothetical protein
LLCFVFLTDTSFCSKTLENLSLLAADLNKLKGGFSRCDGIVKNPNVDGKYKEAINVYRYIYITSSSSSSSSFVRSQQSQSTFSALKILIIIGFSFCIL